MEVYATPSETLAAGVICDCSQVHVGACITDSLRSFCAINEKGCRDGWPYYSPHIQRIDRETGVGIEGTKIDCRLCKKRNTEAPTLAPTTRFKPSAFPTVASTKSPTLVSIATTSTLATESAVTKSEGMSGTTVAIVIGVVGGVVFLGVFGVFYMRMVRGMKETLKEKKTIKPPSFEIQYTPDKQSEDTQVL